MLEDVVVLDGLWGMYRRMVENGGEKWVDRLACDGFVEESGSQG